jgi:hypothetical protein
MWDVYISTLSLQIYDEPKKILLVTTKILLVATKIPLVAMPRRDQWKKNSVGRNKNSVGRDEGRCRWMDAWRSKR